MSDKITTYMAANKYIKNMAKFKHLEIALRNKSCIHKEIMRILNWENAYCHSSQKLLFSWLLSKNIKSKILKTIILLVIIQGVTGGTDQTSGECSLGQTIPI